MELEFICEVGCDWCSVDDRVPVFDGKMIDGLQIVKNKLQECNIIILFELFFSLD